MEERLNKVIARAGVTSRRGADALIEEGRVSVNGRVVSEHGVRVDPERDEIRVDGERIHPERVTDRYLALYKPRHVITTVSDPYDRPTVVDLVDPDERLFPVGRLDGASEGLLLLTNDGALANQLTHPRYEHEKEYRLKISGTPTEQTLRQWREGIMLEDGPTLPAQVTIESSTGPGSWLRIVLREGRNQQLRRMMEARGHRVHRLIRTRMGPITLGSLEPGRWRELTEQEIEALRTGRRTPLDEEEQSRSRRPKYREGWARPKKRDSRRTRRKGPRR